MPVIWTLMSQKLLPYESLYEEYVNSFISIIRIQHISQIGHICWLTEVNCKPWKVCA